MAIVYCDWATGDDTTGDGSASLPYKTITKASTGLTGGDEVRVAKSPEPTALTGTISFTNNSVNITGTNTLFTTELAIGDFILGGDDNWWEVVTITSDTAATLYRVYSGATESGVSSQKLGVTDTGAAGSSDANIQYINSSGTGSAYLKISGGWDLSTQTQTGQTYFRSLDTANINIRWGRGLAGWSKNCIEISKLNFLRYYRAIRMDSTTCNCNIIEPFISSCNDGIAFANAYNINIISPTFVGCTAVCVAADSSFNIKIYGTVKAYSCWAVFLSNKSTMLINKVELIGSSPTYGFTNYANGRVSIGDMGGQSYIYTDGGNIVSQAATAGGTGKEWKFSVTSANRGANYHLDQEIARVLVAANKQVSVKLYFKKSSASAIKAGLFMRGKQIAGVDNDISVECPADTNRNQVTLQFTPTEAGVVSIEAHAWYVSSTTDYVIVDDIDITQAD